MSLQIPKEYGSVSEEVVDEFKELKFEFFVEGVKLVVNESRRLNRRDLFLCLEVNSTNPGLLRQLLDMEENNDYHPHMTVLEKPL